MTTTVAPVSHIAIDKRGRAWIPEANTKVVEIAADVLAYGWSAEEIVCQHPHLTLAQVHSALAYYYDHQNEIEAQLDETDARASDLRKGALNDSPIRQRLREQGKLPTKDSATSRLVNSLKIWR